MLTREEVWNLAGQWAGDDASVATQAQYAKYLWADEQFGALIGYLKLKGVYDNTLVVVQNDHGQEAKGLLYEHGSRILNFVRYPPLFGTERTVLSSDLVVSNVDLAPTIYQLIDATVPDEYVMDGQSWLDAVKAAVNGE